ncbi:MAG: sulfite exporter TauE/SafE family protein [Oligoflexia bacterium]|nr:sulfite exporter TauE/SafE family protein [Oligoflexia bacterium]
MGEYLIGIISAFWFGILTSMSPCPLATNIAAVSYLGSNIEDKDRKSQWKILCLSGFFYAFGRMLTYMLIGIITIKGLYAISSISFFLQKYVNLFIGPFLIVVGMFLLEILSFNFKDSENWLTKKIKKRFDNVNNINGNIGRVEIFAQSFLLGSVFALALCPVSAALFFGSLIPIALKINSLVVAPLVYGFGTAVLVIIFAILIAIGSKSIGILFKKITIVERWVRITMGIIIILIGIYLSVTKIFLESI